MRHYVIKQNNPDALPHNLYMQMLYIIRDFAETPGGDMPKGRLAQRQAAHIAGRVLQAEYETRQDVYGVLQPLRAFFDYAYFSYMFAQRSREMGASKRSWNLYRCRYARLTAEQLGLV